MAVQVLVARVIAGYVGPRAANDEIGAVGTHTDSIETEQLGAATDDVVLTQIAKDDVVTAAALDVIVAVACTLQRSVNDECAVRIVCASATSSIDASPWITSSPSWPKITSSSAPPAMKSSPNAVALAVSEWPSSVICRSMTPVGFNCEAPVTCANPSLP
jgi:hypothetical protein